MTALIDLLFRTLVPHPVPNRVRASAEFPPAWLRGSGARASAFFRRRSAAAGSGTGAAARSCVEALESRVCLDATAPGTTDPRGGRDEVQAVTADLQAGPSPAAADTRAAAAAPDRFVLDMVHHNPGEPRTRTAFLDPRFLARQGYNGQVMQEPVGAAVTFDAFDPSVFPAGSAARRWVLDLAARIDQQVAAADAAGLPIYYWVDMVVLPKTLVSEHRSALTDADGRIDPQRPMTQRVLRVMLAEVFDRFPGIDGLVVRTGEVYTHDVPHHRGNNPILRGPADHVALLGVLRDEVCVARDKTLVYRTWEIGGPGGGFHADPAFYRRVTDAVPTHPNLLFSVKHQAGDFHRMTPFNPTIGIGRHRQIVEVQAQREFEGKGASPNYIGKGVIDGWEEYAWINPAGRPDGLRDLAGDPLFAGVWTWSRGGGWGGPYIQNELWTRLNAYVVSRWAADPSRTERSIFDSFATGIGLTGADVGRFRELCLLSPDAVLRGRLSAAGGVNVWWTRDQYIGGIPLLRTFFQNTIADGRVGAVLAEKDEAVAMWRRMEALAREIGAPDPGLREHLATSTTYGRIQYDIYRQAWTVMLYGMQGDATGTYDRPTIGRAVRQYDALWQEWRALKGSSPSAATLYTDLAFRDVAADGVGASVDRYRKLVVPPPPPPPAAGTLVLEAERAARSGAAVEELHPAYSGDGYVDYQNAAGDWTEWTVDAPAARTYGLSFRYANGAADRPMELSVNGGVVRPRLPFAGTGGWAAWDAVAATVELEAGVNRVRLKAVGLSGPNVDSLGVRVA